MKFTWTFPTTLCLTLMCNIGHADDPIPQNLVGIWATEDAVLKGTFLFEGEALYLDSNGVGMIVGGPPPIGIRVDCEFLAIDSTLKCELIGPQGEAVIANLPFDNVTNTILSTNGKRKLDRIANQFDQNTKKALGLVKR